MKVKTLLTAILFSICVFLLSFIYGYFLSDAYAERPSVCQGPAVYCTSETICWPCGDPWEWKTCCIVFVYTMYWNV